MTASPIHTQVRSSFTFFLGVTIIFLTAGTLFIELNSRSAQVMGSLTANDDVHIQATVNGCILNITILPEKRIPAVNNWQTDLNIEVRNMAGNQLITTLNLTSNNAGVASSDLCALGIFPPVGNFSFFIRGQSHLREDFLNQPGFSGYITSYNFSSDGTRLRAGETHLPPDNKVNSLDLSTQISTIYTASDRNDLNQDGIVNSLDISNTLVNFFVIGN